MNGEYISSCWGNSERFPRANAQENWQKQPCFIMTVPKHCLVSMTAMHDYSFELVDPYSPNLTHTHPTHLTVIDSPSWRCTWLGNSDLFIVDAFHSTTGWHLLNQRDLIIETPMEEVCASQEGLGWKINVTFHERFLVSLENLQTTPVCE